MTTPTEAPREAGPEPLKVVAYRVDWPAEIGIAPDRFYGADDSHRMNCHLSYVHGVAAPIVVPLVRLTDAQSALESERQAHAAEVERLRVDAERYRALVQLRTFSSDECHWNGPGYRKQHLIDAAIDQAIARGKT